MSTPPTGPPPGFYPDDQGTQRYWDGHAWTERTQETTAPAEDPTQPFTVTPPTKAPKKKHTARNVILSALGVIVVLGIIGSIFGGDDTEPAASTASKASPTSRSVTCPSGQVAKGTSCVLPPAPVAEETEPPEPTRTSYRVRFKTTDKQCFGSGEFSAGCLIEGKLLLTITEVQADGVAADITVRITGDEGGAQTETISVDEDGEYSAPEMSLTTPRSATKVKAKVVDVEVY